MSSRSNSTLICREIVRDESQNIQLSKRTLDSLKLDRRYQEEKKKRDYWKCWNKLSRGSLFMHNIFNSWHGAREGWEGAVLTSMKELRAGTVHNKDLSIGSDSKRLERGTSPLVQVWVGLDPLSSPNGLNILLPSHLTLPWPGRGRGGYLGSNTRLILKASGSATDLLRAWAKHCISSCLQSSKKQIITARSPCPVSSLAAVWNHREGAEFMGADI